MWLVPIAHASSTQSHTSTSQKVYLSLSHLPSSATPYGLYQQCQKLNSPARKSHAFSVMPRALDDFQPIV